MGLLGLVIWGIRRSVREEQARSLTSELVKLETLPVANYLGSSLHCAIKFTDLTDRARFVELHVRVLQPNSFYKFVTL